MVGLLGIEWVIDAEGCDAASLRDEPKVAQFLEGIVRVLALTVAKPPVLHRFEGEGGITALLLLSESHLAIHTFPEHKALTLNLYCCKPRPPFDWALSLRETFGATNVTVRELTRGEAT
ncbi:MAG: S-adenosylmethionine decarboxylase [Polyangiaceae bacterium]